MRYLGSVLLGEAEFLLGCPKPYRSHVLPRVSAGKIPPIKKKKMAAKVLEENSLVFNIDTHEVRPLVAGQCSKNIIHRIRSLRMMMI